jgi:hypothetical protein
LRHLKNPRELITCRGRRVGQCGARTAQRRCLTLLQVSSFDFNLDTKKPPPEAICMS